MFDNRGLMEKLWAMKIKERPKKKKLRLPFGVEAEEAVQYKRLPQLNKFFARRRVYGFGQG